MHTLNASNSQESCTFVPQFVYNHRRPGVPSGQAWSSTTVTKDLATKAFSANKPEDWFCLGKGNCTPMDRELVILTHTEHFG